MEALKFEYMLATGTEYFSLSDTDMTNARHFISFLLNFAIEHGIPLQKSPLDYTDDITAALYSCLVNKKCIICGAPADCHHTENIGMGRDRDEIIHLGMPVMALCRKHHSECHNIGQSVFNDKYHIYGVLADEKICEVYKLKKEA